MSDRAEPGLGSPASATDGPPPAPVLTVAASPHLVQPDSSTRRMMLDVLIGLAPVIVAALLFFGVAAALQLGICVTACLLAETLLVRWRGRATTLGDFSAAVTGVILGLSLPGGAPWYVGVVASFVAIGIGKVAFGGLGQNIFNPAMVGRAFVMIGFPASLGASAYVLGGGEVPLIVTQATPLTAAKQLGASAELMPLMLGNVNGSPGETSALACLLGGLWLCWRRTASWQIPAGMVAAVAVLAGLGDLLAPGEAMTMSRHLLGGSLLFGAFFIATDPVSSPITGRGKWIFGAGTGAFVLLIRTLSGYPEGVMFAVLLMNGLTPLINRWTIPTPRGGAAAEAAS